jgi:hypothetical protein
MSKMGAKIVKARASGPKLTAAQVRILQTLSRFPDGLTLDGLANKTDSPSTISINIGPVSKALITEHDVRNGRPSLHSLGLVRVIKEEDFSGRDMNVWALTEEGERIADTYVARKGAIDTQAVPDDVLAPVVREIRNRLVHGLELMTVDDVMEIRNLLPVEYQDTPLDSIKQQAINLRKIGKLSNRNDNVEDSWPLWYREYREGEHFDEIITRTFNAFRGQCCINQGHIKGLTVLHRSLDRLGDEDIADTFLICQDCIKRSRKSLVEIPANPPSADGEER